MVCKLHVRPSGFSCAGVALNRKTHNDSPANVKTYDFIRMVSFRGHSQYLATWAKMTPWQMDCKMPSIRMGALIGTSVCAASDSEDIMGVDVGRPASCGDALMHHLQSWSGPSDTDDQPETKHDEAHATWYPSPQSLSLKSCPRADSIGYSATLDAVRLAVMPRGRAARRMLPCGPFNEMSPIKSTVTMIKKAASCGPYAF